MNTTANDRRAFLRRSLMTGLGLGLGGGYGLGLPAEAAEKIAAGDAGAHAIPWGELADKMAGPLLRPGDPGFADLALPYNLVNAPVVPGAIARCVLVNDVAQAIQWARENGVPLVARSGGHSMAGFAVTTGLMIDVKLLNQTSFDSNTGIATIGGGLLNGGLYQALQANNVTITHGRCPKVGAAGYLLGGGIGFDVRRLGIASDSMVKSQIVTAEGDILTLSDKENSDLFWACRGGGGGNFGINTSFSVQTSPAPKSVTASRLIWTEKIDRVLPAIFAALQDCTVRLGAWITATAVTPEELASGEDVNIIFEGQLVGPPEELADILAPVYEIKRPSISDIKVLSYWDAQDNFFTDTPESKKFLSRTQYFRGRISPAICAVLLDFLRRWPGTSKSATASFMQMGGAVNALPPDATAFVHRTSDWLLLYYPKWSVTDPEEVSIKAMVWQASLYDAVAPYAIPEAYQNFMDYSLQTYLSQYYRSNLGRLMRVKAAVDPTEVFKFPQSIPPAKI